MLVLSRYNNGASLTDLKKLRYAMGRFKNSSTGRWQVATGHSQQGRPGGDGRGVGHPGAGRRGQVQPAGAAPEVGSLFFCQRSSRSLCWGWVLQFRKVAPKIWTILFLTSSIFNSKVWNNDLVEPNFWYRWSIPTTSRDCQSHFPNNCYDISLVNIIFNDFFYNFFKTEDCKMNYRKTDWLT